MIIIIDFFFFLEAKVDSYILLVLRAFLILYPGSAVQKCKWCGCMYLHTFCHSSVSDLSFQYFNSRKHYWAEEGDIKTDVGDVILIERLPQKTTPLVSHRIKEQVFKLGAVVDPVTGQRCRGTTFIDEELRQLEAEQIEEERVKKASSAAPSS